MARQKEDPAIPTVHAALDLLTVDRLKQLVALLPTNKRPTRKMDLAAVIEQYLVGEKLRALWEQLDDKQKLAVAETIYSVDGTFNADRFRAKYGALPVFGTKKDQWSYSETPSFRDALGKPAAETLRAIWQRWLKAKLLDEFNRIDVIKGQHGKGKRALTATEGRRALIAEALKQCPVGGWVEFDEFSRFTQTAGFEFEVTRDPWSLYISDPHYGSLGYAGFHDWHIVQGRYLLCLLFEYAATLGMIDVAYIEPKGARRDYREMWGTDDLNFLSRYDGLIYFRLNPLGVYCLGLTDDYQPSRREARTVLTVLPGLQINVARGVLSTEEALLLETWAEKESETLWRLDRDKALCAIEGGHSITELHEFLQVRDEQSLPETVEGFIAITERQAWALKNTGTALLIECADAEIADRIATHEGTKKLCLRAGERHLAVKTEAEEQFRKALHVLGYGMPRV